MCQILKNRSTKKVSLVGVVYVVILLCNVCSSCKNHACVCSKWTLTCFNINWLFFIIIIHLLNLATRMTTLGKTGEYCPFSEEWSQYIEHLEFFLIANKVKDDTLKSVVDWTLIEYYLICVCNHLWCNCTHVLGIYGY